jgi:CubicO group peptidase (beta-lactamase class C family)
VTAETAAPARFPYEPPAPRRTSELDERLLAQTLVRFAAQQVRGRFPGGQLVARWRGRVIARLCVGVRAGWRAEEGAARVPVAHDTPFAVFSAGKPVVALAVAICEERGLLDVNAPIADVVPGFDAHDKREITTLDVLTHRSGLLMEALAAEPARWEDWDFVRRAVIEAKPSAPRGRLAYSPLGFGWVLAVVVEHVTGTPFHGFVAREIAAPLELPALRFGAAGRDPASFARAYWLARRPVRVAGRDVGEGFEAVNNSPGFLRALVPGAGLVCDAATLAAFYDALLRGGVARSGRHVVSEDVLAKYLSCEARGFDASNRAPLAVGRGFLLGTALPSVYGWLGTSHVYGHAGAFSTVAFADPERELAAAIVTNGNGTRGALLRRFAPLCAGLRKACPKREDAAR